MKNKLTVFTLLLCFIGWAQDKSSTSDELEKTYLEYINIPREVIFVHLNKGLYVKGEALAFNAYVFEKQTKQLSESTTTLYCEILDNDQNRVGVKMLKVVNGTVSNQFDISEEYKPGTYTFKAYTNWLRNFPENNHFEANFTVVDREELNNNYEYNEVENIDAQFLPEGGHLLEGVINTVGVVVKKENGRAFKNASGYILENDKKITEFYTNHLGIGILTMKPKLGVNYKAVLKLTNHNVEFDFPIVRERGVSLAVNSEDQIIIQLNTNESTLESIKGNTYKVMVHNGSKSFVIDTQLEDYKTILIIDKDQLDEGIQIITVFNEKNVPILERLLFIHKEKNRAYVSKATVSKRRTDSVFFNLEFANIINDSTGYSKLSVSILPQETLAYEENSDIYSQIYLKPYVKGEIEKAPYYFNKINRKKKYELDLLLLTQGWSSYSWDSIFKKDQQIKYVFETGITARLEIKKRNHRKFMIHKLQHTNLDVIEIPKNEESFKVNGLFPKEKEQLLLSYINSSGKIKRTSLNAYFSPSSIPSFNKSSDLGFAILPTIKVDSEPFFEDAEELETIVINADKIRERNLKNTSRGTVDYFNDFKRNSTQLVTYLSNRGYRTSNYNGQFILEDPRRSSNGPPIIVIDGAIYRDTSVLINFTFDQVDYIEIFRNGTGAPQYKRPNQGDVIKITTNPKLRRKISLDRISEFSFPIHYSSNKEFYKPKYSLINSDFYNYYAVYDWKEELSISNSNNVNFSCRYNGSQAFKLIIEGATSNGQLIHEVIDLNLD